MTKAIHVATAICNVQGNQLLIILAVGEDGYVYQMISGRWEKLPALDSQIDTSVRVIGKDGNISVS